MKTKILPILIIAIFGLMSSALQAQNNAVKQKLNKPADAEMQAEMRRYVDLLDLTPEQTFATAEALKWKMEKKQAIFDQIEALKNQLSGIDLNTDKQIMSTLTEDQRQILLKEIEPAMKADREKQLKKISE